MAKLTFTPDSGGNPLEMDVAEEMITGFDNLNPVHVTVANTLLKVLQEEISARNSLSEGAK